MDVCLYMRMSTDKQENSIDSQRRILINYAKTHSLQIISEYLDEGISGRKADKRPAFMQMIDDSKQNIFDAVLIYDSSRFARNLEESLVYKSILKKNNVSVISATEPVLDEDTGLITDALLGAMNELYSRKLGKQVKRGMVEKANAGFCITRPPFGYERGNEKAIFKINPPESEVVKDIFKMYTTWLPSMNGIARILNQDNNFNRTFDGKVIKQILKSEFYIGIIEWDGIKSTGKHEAIVDADTFKKAQVILNQSNFKRDPSSYKHWLSGIIKCGYCGKSMSLISDRYPRFKCNKKSIGLCSFNNDVRLHLVEAVVYNAINDIVCGVDVVNIENVVFRNNTQDEKALLAAELKKLTQKLDRAKQAYLNGIDTIEEYKTVKTKLNFDIEILEEKIKEFDYKQLDIIKIKKEIRSRAETIKEILALQDEHVQKASAIRQIIERVEYERNSKRFTIFFKY